MKKRRIAYLPGPIKRVLALGIAVLLLGPTVAFAAGDNTAREEMPPYEPPEVYTSGEYSYIINEDGTITISYYEGEEEELVIPTEIDGYAVSAIGGEAFSYAEMKSLTIPEEIGEIEGRAFEYCSISDSVEFPANIVIGHYAFSYAYLPSVLCIPGGAQVGREAFSYCEGLKVLIVGSQAVMGKRCFGYSDDLKKVVCAEGAALEEDAFEYCGDMEQVILCGDVSMHKDAFSYCGHVKITQADKEELSEILATLSIEEAKVAANPQKGTQAPKAETPPPAVETPEPRTKLEQKVTEAWGVMVGQFQSLWDQVISIVDRK